MMLFVAVFTSKSYRFIFLVNSLFKCMVFVSKFLFLVFEISLIRCGCIVWYCFESLFVKLDGDGG